MTESDKKKGKATPKRKEAVAKTKINSITAPATKATKSRDKDALRAARAAARAAYMRGDENALPVRDKGPVKKYVRNYVDSRRTIGEFFLPAIMAVLVLTMIPNKYIQLFAILFMYSLMLYSFVSGLLFSRKIKKIIEVKFPGESTKGVGIYGFLRSTQIRRLRAPQPQVNRGDNIN
jgi:hypothetical protein